MLEIRMGEMLRINCLPFYFNWWVVRVRFSLHSSFTAFEFKLCFFTNKIILTSISSWFNTIILSYIYIVIIFQKNLGIRSIFISAILLFLTCLIFHSSLMIWFILVSFSVFFVKLKYESPWFQLGFIMSVV